tara:strand:- start:669 stop:872 length:204 start_codon:yes stop_codon:yes gene_type:complete
MQLKEYLQKKKYTQKAFINLVKEETGHSIPQGTLAKYILGVRIPRKKEMVIIHSVTKGKVSPNDFYL